MLIYDVGAHTGEDTAHYLSLGHRVVAVEADPDLADSLRARFVTEIADRRLAVLGVAVAETPGRATFYRVPTQLGWNSFDRAQAERGGPVVAVEVECRAFADILTEHGVPHYLKVDIEGFDHLCVMALAYNTAPAFVSFESGEQTEAMLTHLVALGYRRFRLVNQQNFQAITVPRAGGRAHLAWSARQFVRLALRKRPAVHRALGKVLALRNGHTNGDYHTANVIDGWTFTEQSSGPIPTEHSSGWLDPVDFMATWVAMRDGGVIGSAWFDVQAHR